MKKRHKLGYGIGDMGAGTIWGLTGGFLMVYMTDTVGISAALLGTLFLAARLFDGVSDAFMGTLIDNTHTKIGKARPWFLASILPLVVCTILLFNIPSSFSVTGKSIYFFVMYFVVTVVFYTINNVSYNSFPALVTDKTEDRIGMALFRYVSSISTGLVVSVITIPLLKRLGGLNNQAAWSKVVLLYCLIGLVALTITGFSVKEIITAKKAKIEANKEDSIPFYKAFKYTFSNKYFLIMITDSIMMMTRMGVAGAGIYYAQYNLGNADLVGVMSIASLLPMIVGMLISAPFLTKFGMQKSRIIGSSISLFGGILAALFGNNFSMLLLGNALIAFGIGPSSASNSALLAHVVDYGEWKNKAKLAGTIFSCNSVGTKLGTGIGSAIVGWGLATGGYMAGSPSQSASALFAIKAVCLYIPVVLLTVGLILNCFLDIEKKIPEIKKELAARNELKSGEN